MTRMSRIKVTSTMALLQKDMDRIVRQAPKDMDRVTELNAKRGNRIAADFARHTAGRHGKHYHKAFTIERVGEHVWEYGPDSAMPQGGMSFEYGSRNQPPHLDLNKSADIAGPLFARDVARFLPDKWFW